MSEFIKTPEPPYYAVITSFVMRDEMDEGDFAKYRTLAASLMEIAKDMPGFYGEEAARGDGLSLSVSYWKDEDAITAWRENAKHEAARQFGKENWYERVVVRVARVERGSEFKRQH